MSSSTENPGSSRKRLFVGNIHDQITSVDLKQRFGNFGSVENVEIRNKNETTFAFIDMDFGENHVDGLRKCIDMLNNAKWKGLLLKVQVAKENFIEKLRYEREHLRNLKRPRPPDNFDFEIVMKAATKASETGITAKKVVHQAPAPDPDKQVNGRLETSKPKQEQKKAVVQESPPEVIPKSKFKIPAPTPPAEKPAEKPTPAVEKPAKRMAGNKISSSDSSTEDSSDDEDNNLQIPMFKGILAYPSLAEIKPEPEPVSPSPQTDQPEPKPSTTPFTGLKLNPLKKQRSDALRVQSLQKSVDLKKTRDSIVRHALANKILVEQEQTAEAPSTKPTDTNSDFLFGSDEVATDDKMDEDEFKIRPQYEGKSGQHLMELSSKFGGDERFRIDERFAEEETGDSGVKVEEEGSERQVQLDVLNELFGPSSGAKTPTTIREQSKNHSNASKSYTESSSPLGLIRYQPSSTEHKLKYELKPEVDVSPKKSELAKIQKNTKNKADDKNAESHKPMSTSVAISTDETPTYKVAANLKQLFSDQTTDSVPSSTTFSLLSSFSNTSNTDKINNSALTESSMPSKSKVDTAETVDKTFWNNSNQPNPFKYDSSDDEDGETGSKKGKVKKPASTEPITVTLKTDHTQSMSNTFFQSEPFYFVDNDARLEKVFETFLHSDENMDEVIRQFNDEGGRAELKTIAKAKWRNSNRKNEKRIQIMKQLRRKKKRDVAKKFQHQEKIRAMREQREQD